VTVRFAFSAEQNMFRDTARDLLAKRCPPTAVRAAWNEPAGRVPGLWAALAELGVVGLTTPEAHGGLGMSELDLVLVLEEAGRAAMPEPLLETTAVGAPLIRDAAPAAIREAWLPKIAAGEAVIAVGLDGASQVAFASEAALLLLASEGEIHAVPREEVTLTAQPSVDGSRRLAAVAWTPSSATRIAGGAPAQTATAAAFDRGALAAAAELVGLARRMIDMAVEHAKVREQFGKPIGSFQAVKHHLASALVSVELARPLVYRAAYSLARGDVERSAHASMAKAQASDAARIAARAALQCHGAIGYSVEYDLHLYMKRAWALAAAWGDAASHRARVGDAVFSTPEGAS
jgi:alkylation response protein AidB-like acyl-CoA dehydrogenase